MQKNNLLVEILTEELPPLSQKSLAEVFAQNISESIHNLGLSKDINYEVFSTPRRLGVLVKDVSFQGAIEKKVIKLMPASIGFDDKGNPTNALEKKLISLGEDLSALNKIQTMEEKNQSNLFIEKEIQGKKLFQEIPIILSHSLESLPIKKLMSYQLKDGWTTVNFVRPMTNLMVIYGDSIVNVECMGLQSSHHTIGHRFSSKENIIEIKHADNYQKIMLETGSVQVDFEERKKKIADDIADNVSKINADFHALEDNSLLDEVTSLVEMPNILIGQFEKRFLKIPQECLILTMKSNQKYFPILNKKNELTNYFVIVSNINPQNTKHIIHGNEKVIRPRLADAEFFYNKDKAYTLKKFSENLSSIIYHNKLGTQHDRALRVAKILVYLSKKLGFTSKVDFKDLALHSKADLLSLMVGEFPDLQGIIGRYYAIEEAHTQSFANAIEDHYKPKFSGDELPRDLLGDMLSLAEKTENLIGLFSINEKPSGVKDPFGLRRNAIGLIRILIEKKISLDVVEMIDVFYPSKGSTKSHELKEFINDRLVNYLKDNGYSSQQVDAVAGVMPSKLHDIIDRLDAVKTFTAFDESDILAATNKRVTNILKKYDVNQNTKIDIKLFQETEENNLYEALNKTSKEISGALKVNNYTKALTMLIELKDPIDSFFEKIMVNAEDKDIRANRHNLLIQLHKEMNCVADISKLSS